MRIQTEDSLLAGATLVFLDTADWSYMEEARRPEATAELRALCAAGHARVLVTADHLVEVGGLTRGRTSRLRFMRRFPGTVLLSVGGAQVTKLAAYRFAISALGGEMKPQPLRCQPMSTESVEALERLVEQTRPLQLAQRFRASVMSRTFGHGAKQSKQEREMQLKLHRLARTGAKSEVLEYLRKRWPLTGLRRVLQPIAAHALVAVYRWGNDRGILSSASKTDFLFDELVSSALPSEISRDPQMMHFLFGVWSRPEALASLSPSLACVAAIARGTSPTKDAAKIRSTEIDKCHAAFAPLVDVFTCDGRIQRLVSQTLKVPRPQTAVLRTSSLEAVVDALSSSASRTAMPSG